MAERNLESINRLGDLLLGSLPPRPSPGEPGNQVKKLYS